MPPQNEKQRFPIRDNVIVTVEDPDFAIKREGTEDSFKRPSRTSAPGERSEGKIDELLKRKGKSPQFKLRIGNMDLEELGIARNLRQLRISEHEDLTDIVEFDFDKADILFNKSIFNEPVITQVSTGYRFGEGTRLESRGRFVLVKPTVSFSARGSRLFIVGVSEQMLMATEQKRRPWRNVTDSEIAERIAGEYPFIQEVDITDTDVRYESVIQANMTDWEFLRSRASLHGFQVFVRDGVLHFHKVREVDTGIVFNIKGKEANIETLSGKIEQLRGAPKIRGSVVDPFTGKTIEIVSGFEADPILKDETGQRFANRILNARALGRGSTEFIEPMQSITKQDAIEKEIQAAADAARFVVMTDVFSTGHERVHPGSVVTITGIGKFSGKYVVRAVDHIIQVGPGYTMRLKLRRTFTGEVDQDESPQDVTNRSNVTGVHLFDSFQSANPDSVEFGAPDPITGQKSSQTLTARDRAILRETGVNSGIFQGEFIIPGVKTFRTKTTTKPQATSDASPDAGKSEENFRRSIEEGQFEDQVVIITDPLPVEDFPGTP